MVQAIKTKPQTEQWQVKFIAVHPKTKQRICGNWTISSPSKVILMRRLAIVYPGFELRSFQWKQLG